MDLCELSNNPNWKAKRHPWERARIKVVSDLMKRRLAAPGNVRVLDIGSGDAYLVHQLATRLPALEIHCVDVEYTDEIKTRLKSALGEKRISLYKSLDEFSDANPGMPIDVVLLLDVIEHIEDDHAFLRGLRNRPAVNESTEILVTVPAHQSLFSAHDVFLKHYRRYSEKLLLETLDRCGYRAGRSGYFFFSLLTARYLQTKFSAAKDPDRQKGISGYKPVFPVDQAMYGVLRTDYALSSALRAIGIKTPGLSCYAICRPEKES